MSSSAWGDKDYSKRNARHVEFSRIKGRWFRDRIEAFPAAIIGRPGAEGRVASALVTTLSIILAEMSDGATWIRFQHWKILGLLCGF
jgi:hypothetical protein